MTHAALFLSLARFFNPRYWVCDEALKFR
jgi:hypothetical protein